MHHIIDIVIMIFLFFFIMIFDCHCHGSQSPGRNSELRAILDKARRRSEKKKREEEEQQVHNMVTIDITDINIHELL